MYTAPVLLGLESRLPIQNTFLIHGSSEILTLVGFHTEVLGKSVHGSGTMFYYTDGPPPPQIVSTLKGKDTAPGDNCVTQYGEIEDTCSAFLSEDRERRIKRVFLHLEVLCVTTEAKISLWEWQLAYARRERNETFLPNGGKMTNDRTGWVSRVGRAIIGSGTLYFQYDSCYFQLILSSVQAVLMQF